MSKGVVGLIVSCIPMFAKPNFRVFRAGILFSHFLVIVSIFSCFWFFWRFSNTTYGMDQWLGLYVADTMARIVDGSELCSWSSYLFD